MTNLYFLRHGHAHDRDEWKTQNDELRPLTTEGIAAMRQEAIVLRHLQPDFTAIVTSPLVRARETADIIHTLFPDLPITEDALLKPGFGLKALEKVLKQHDGHESLLLVGHEPDFSAVISDMIGGGRVTMKRGGMARVKLASKEKLRGDLIWLITPSVFRAAED
ncbi:MAG: histidine phosphatase family protein [Anaerolineae bacterium]|nr:histidine phosphatase family protein [Anaerolineae bacterium]